MTEIALLDVLNANCGDVLKAHILNEKFGMAVNLISVRAPAGEAEKAFAVSRANLVEAEPKAATADSAMAAFKKAAAIPVQAAKPVPVETLPKMPATFRFEDAAPEVEAAEAA
ncbi:hypothetical protein [Mesorhizobium sp. BR-1-1-10]|uniref:hypothetical protein n=1 Tax=Mesorhizobium sp. BR-1-1-10 TaxID=2876660 RepID=UPI001CD123EB|nr:hypothetical protein [Mesorhizobium sp. BR-1-1-10]MBZ9975500.1 hypothetical protein [Mesorhizobium sp. BR-1-1-10]